ncbi:hypothetical protein [Tomitella gaofuii]|uniref:hypothetical protein n=1 Tax=Tomitella gaofuii TaxID=2760083 RepID=UPI0015FE53B0|nr:hypothetical protein [Tomitella gaofuii]
MSIARVADLTPAQWIADRAEEWDRLVSRGPFCFDRYARLRLIPDPSRDGQRESESPVSPGALSDDEQIGVVLSELASFTCTPADCCFLVWEGWPCFHADDQMPRLAIPNRDYFLFHGAVADAETWDGRLKALLGTVEAPTPAFVWPADRAWCVTCDIDSHFATIGGSADAVDAVLALTEVDVVDDFPGVEPPRYC